MEKSQCGQYTNLVGVEKGHDVADNTLPTQGAAVLTQPQAKVYQAPQTDTRQQSIVRQSSLKSAVDFADESLTVDDVLAVAAKFEAWVNRQES
jgi:hypothetical protein